MAKVLYIATIGALRKCCASTTTTTTKYIVKMLYVTIYFLSIKTNLTVGAHTTNSTTSAASHVTAAIASGAASNQPRPLQSILPQVSSNNTSSVNPNTISGDNTNISTAISVAPDPTKPKTEKAKPGRKPKLNPDGTIDTTKKPRKRSTAAEMAARAAAAAAVAS